MAKVPKFSKNSKNSSLVIVINALAIITLIWFGWGYMSRRGSRDINGLTQKAGKAFVVNDFKAFYRHVDAREKESFDLTESEARALWEELFAPRIERYFSNAQCQLQPMSKSQATYVCTHQIEGETIESGVLATWSPRKGTVSLFMQLPELWKLEYREQTKRPLGDLGEYEAIIAGILKDREVLEKYGVTGTIGNAPTSKVASWDSVLSTFRRIIAQQENLKTN